MKIEVIHDAHDYAQFSCGISELDHYLQYEAIKQTEKQLSIAYVLNNEEKQVTGYYTLSSTMIELCHSQFISGACVHHLAVDKEHQKNGYGEILLLDALYRAHLFSEKHDQFVVIVHANTKNAVRFYKKYGFIPFLGRHEMMYLSKTPALL